MIKKLIMVISLTLFLTSCLTTGESAKKSTAPAAKKPIVAKVAVVSLNVNNYGAFGTPGAIPANLITDNMNKVLSTTESTLGNYWKVKNVKSFIYNKTYRGLYKSRNNTKYFTPTVGKSKMALFSTNRNDVIKGVISKKTAQGLCRALAVDAVTLVYSEWTIQSGRFSPTLKALTKTCVSMYDKTGTQLFYGRKDVMGKKIIGSPRGMNISGGTIGEWLVAYQTGLKEVLKKNAGKVK